MTALRLVDVKDQPHRQARPDAAMEIRSVLFDFDGTLIDSMGLVYEAFQTSIENALGRRPPRAEIRRFFGLPESEIIRRIVGSERAEYAIEEFHRVYESRHAAEAKVFPGIMELIERLPSAGVALGIVTGKGRRSTEFALRAFGLDRWFKVVITGDDVTHPKPDPEGILKAVQCLGESREHVLYVGDAAADVEMGLAAGVRLALPGWNPEVVWVNDNSVLRLAQPEQLLELLAIRKGSAAADADPIPES